MATLGGLVVLMKGVPSRVNAYTLALDSESTNVSPLPRNCLDGFTNSACTIGDASSQPGAIVIGDSHAHAIVTSVAEGARTAERGATLFLGHASCLTIPGATLKGAPPSEQCGEHLKSIYQELASKYVGVPIFVINRTSVYVYGHNEDDIETLKGPQVYFGGKPSASFDEFLSQFRNNYVGSMCALAKNRPVFVMKPVPEMKRDVPRVVTRKIMLGQTVPDIYITKTEYSERNRFVLDVMEQASRECGIILVDPLPYLCETEKCAGIVNGRALYADDDHLSEYGNKALAPMFAAALQPASNLSSARVVEPAAVPN
jgi:hypothetical protein